MIATNQKHSRHAFRIACSDGAWTKRLSLDPVLSLLACRAAMTKLSFEDEHVEDDELILEEDGHDQVAVPPPMPRAARRTSHFAISSSKGPAVVTEGDILGGKYCVEREMGRAELAIVVRVRHVELGSRFILKLLSAEACSHPDNVARLLQGARAAFQLQSEHTARIVDAGRLAGGAPFVVSELLSGCGLRETLRTRGALSSSEAVDFVLQASESIAEAHAAGLVHGHLSLSHLFVARRPDGSPTIKVLDFGVAAAFKGDPLSPKHTPASGFFDQDMAFDSLAYTSPEQVRRRAEIDGRADIWALGCILHEMLSGFPAFRSDTASGLLAMIVADDPVPLTALRSDVPRRVEAVVLRCLAKDREARFASLADLVAELKPCASPDAQSSADRVIRTLGRGKAALHAGPSRAMVHIGPAQSPAVTLVDRNSVKFQLMWSTALVAFGLVGGVIAGAILTRAPQAAGASMSTAPPATPRETAAAPLEHAGSALATEVAPGAPPGNGVSPMPAVVAPPDARALVAASPPITLPSLPMAPSVPAPTNPRPRQQVRAVAQPAESERARSAAKDPKGARGERSSTAEDLFDDVR